MVFLVQWGTVIYISLFQKVKLLKTTQFKRAGKGRFVQFTHIKHNKRRTEVFILYEKQIRFDGSNITMETDEV